MSKRMSWIFALPIAAALAGCATGPVVTSQTVIVAGVGPVEIERLTSGWWTSTGPIARSLSNSAGANRLVEVPPLFGDLQTVRVRRQCRRLGGSRACSWMSGCKRRGSKPGITYTEATSGPFQNLPDKYVVRGVTITARFEQFDAASGVVSCVGPLGPRSITATDPAVRAELQTFRKGEMVDLSFVEAFRIILS